MTGFDLVTYTARFNDLAALCPTMVNPESKKVERYIWGLSPQMQGHVLASNPITYNSAKRLAQRLIDHGAKQSTITTAANPPREAQGQSRPWNKRRGQILQENPKKQQVIATHAITVPTNSAPTSSYNGKLPKCNQCNFHHHGLCRDLQCTRCNKKGHTARYCKEPTQQSAPTANTGVSRACFECGSTGHYRKDCPKANNRNIGGRGRVFAMGQDEAIADPTVVTGTFLLDNSYACILFDSGAERSFVSHDFKGMLKPIPQSLSEPFIVEMANGKTEGTKEIYLNCTLTLNDNLFQINLMPVSIKSFDVIIGMDWLSSHRADILCYDKAVRLNLPTGENFLVLGDKPSTTLRIISSIQAQKYLRKECHAFLAHVVDVKREVRDIKDVPDVCDFPDVFPEDLPGIPPVRQVEFRIDLIPGATPVAKAPYRLAPAEMQELSSQLNELLGKGFIRPSFSPWGAPVLFVKKKDGSFRICIDYR